MLDFMMISTRSTKRGEIEIFPKFIIKESNDLMIRGSDFYAVWIEEKGLWSTKEQDVLQIIDNELLSFKEKNKNKFESNARILHMWDASTGMIDQWHKYCKYQMRDTYKLLDEKLIFSNMKPKKTDYASKTLEYPLVEGVTTYYDKLMGALYDPEERHKLEWVIGSIVCGDSKKLQKFMVLYGSAGTGKSTILNIVEQLFKGYWAVFDAKALGSSNAQFALEAFKTNPLVAIQHDGDLSRIEDNTRLNSVVSHETMSINEKFKSSYAGKFKAFLFMGTNKPVKITDAKSGLIRRLIDVSPSGNKLPHREYNECVKNVAFELGPIAQKCKEVYLEDKNYYDSYIPVAMLGASNDFYNFVIDSYNIFKEDNGVSLKAAWEMYKNYCADTNVLYPNPQRIFKEELRNYFEEYKDRHTSEDGTRFRSYYYGFKSEKFENEVHVEDVKPNKKMKFEFSESLFDVDSQTYPAQYASAKETPLEKWDNVKSTLSEINTKTLHYVKVPENHIVIDFDIKDENGEKSLSKNMEAASKWPATYGELSKGGSGVHLHYIYLGDVSKLSRVFDTDIEIKVFNGNSSLRRRLSYCNDIPISTISSGLPLKKEKKMVNKDVVTTEKGLRTLIKRALDKDIHPGTKSSMDFIHKILNDAYNSGVVYDVSSMRNSVLSFALHSTHQSDYCLKLMSDIPFKSEVASLQKQDIGLSDLVFFDVEVFPNLFVVCWKAHGKDKPVVRMINPTSSQIEELLSFNLVGFNNRKYDNHILYARLLGYNELQLYNLSQKIVTSGKSNNYMFSEAYNISYTDVFDFASAGNKKSLKKWEIELGIHHQELGLPWDKPVDPSRWEQVAEYCCNDVVATEITFDHLNGDWTARQILADLADMSVNTTTNTLTTKIIFGNTKKPQSQFVYRDLSKPVKSLSEEMIDFLKESHPSILAQKHGEAKSILPYFPGYKYEFGKSTYRGEEVSEGGEVYAEPGIYTDVALLDIVSMHPNSAIAEIIFGCKFTAIFRDIVDGRVSIKHEAWSKLDDLLDGKLKPYIQKVLDGVMTSKQLADALKTAINSVYGLTSAHFENAFRDPRNIDNIVAKRGSLFMIDLRHAVQEQGFTVAHIKTDSIKIPNATPEIIRFVHEFGARYGYEFEHEATYSKMCLVNDAVYIAKYDDSELNGKKAGKWTATGTQFAVPYVFKTLFSHEPIEFSDLCETKSVTTALYLDMNEGMEDVSYYEKSLKKIRTKERSELKANSKYQTPDDILNEIEQLKCEISKGHNYIFVGKVGSFCPILPEHGGGILVREKDDSYNAATGSIGYRWLESETVKTLNKEKDIDQGYHIAMVDKALEAISKYGDAEWFMS